MNPYHKPPTEKSKTFAFSIRIPEDLYKRLKYRTFEEKTTMNKWLMDAIETKIEASPK